MRKVQTTPMNVCLLLAEQCSAASVTFTQEFFHAANLLAGTTVFRVTTASWDGHPVPTMSGHKLQVDVALSNTGKTDLVVIPGFLFTLREALPYFDRYKSWLRDQHSAGALVASMCTASFLLAECGLLPGVTVTTHWAFAEFFRRKYPTLMLDVSRIFHDEKRIITSGGASAALDLLLYLVRRYCSPHLSRQCSRYMLIDNVRNSQSEYLMWPTPINHADDRILQVQNWLEDEFSKHIVIDDIAQRFGFGIRNFKRRFKDATGTTPLTYLQMLRVEKAKYLLETTRMSLEQITNEIGYEDSSSFTRLFQSRVGTSPTNYRRKFQLPKAADLPDAGEQI